MTTILPAPGVYPGVAADVYHAWPTASNSRLTQLKRSPAHLQAYLANPVETAAMIVGRATHSAILEPDDFTARFGRCPDGLDRRKKPDAALYDGLLARYGASNLLKAPAYDACLAMRDAVYAHASAKGIAASHREVELSLRFDELVADDFTSIAIRCKARPDCHTPELAGGTLWDIKTTTDASRNAFEKTIFSMGYHRQAAFYLAGARSLGLPAEHFVFVAVEKEPPYAVATYRLTEGAIDAGMAELKALATKYVECERLDHWPAYSPRIEDIALPAWAWAQVDDFAADGAA